MQVSKSSGAAEAWPTLVACDGAAGFERERLIDSLEESLCAIWVRARVCLGGATLKALFDRVLGGAQGRWPHLAFVETTCAGVRFDRQHADLAAAPAAALKDSYQQVVREVVLVLDSVSGLVLSRPLREAVDAVNGRCARG